MVFAWLACGPARARETLALDADWRFHLGEVAGAEARDFDTRGWRRLDLPHDWSIELPVNHAAPTGGHGGFFPAGIGWYRREFNAPESWRGRRVAIEFDGVCMNCEVWLNGASLGAHPYGYTPFRFDLTPHLRLGAANALAVRIDAAAQPSSRWYSGSGIYRHVRLVVTAPVHFAPDGMVVTPTAVSENSAAVRVATEIQNETDRPSRLAIETVLLDPDSREVARADATSVIAAHAAAVAPLSLEVPHPRAWSPESPALYRVVTRLRADGGVTDEIAAPVGMRTIRVSAERGLELNGRPLKLNGGNVHHDNGVLGAAAFDRAEERRVALLKAAGFNAVRTAHNPPSPAFLEACDRLGLLVLDEAFDGWEKKKTAHDYGAFFAEWSQRDVAAMVLRDRNHPSVILWSIGNEVYERASPRGAEIARALAEKIRALDPTRPITAGINGPGKNDAWTNLDPLFATLDVAGYNYELARHAGDHARLPARVIVSTESYQSETFANWAIAHDTPCVLGDFVWSAMDYLGEAGIGRVFSPGEPIVRHWEGDMWPWHGAACGDLDLIGERKPISHYRAIVWDGGEKLYAAVLVPPPGGGAWGVSPWTVAPARASWTWPGSEGRELTVEVYSRHDAVRLFLNGRLLGEKPTTRAEEFHARFAVPFAPGELKAVGVSGGRAEESFTLRTAGAVARVRVTLDRTQLRADGEDLAFATIEAVDAHDVVNPNVDAPVQLAIEGPATLAGIGNADLASSETCRANPHRLFGGRALAVVRSTHARGWITLTISSPGLAPARVQLETR